MNRGECHKKLEGVLNAAQNARQCSNSDNFDKQAGKAISEAIQLMDDLVGDIYAQSLWQSGHNEFPVGALNNDFPSFNKKALARFIYDMRSLLTKARMNPEILARDLHQMALDNGSTPKILTMPERNKSFRDGRDLKKTARKLICEIVYFEHGRTRKTITEVRSKLNETKDRCFDAERKAWERMTKEVSSQNRKIYMDEGKNSDKPHPRIGQFQQIWNIANTP